MKAVIALCKVKNSTVKEGQRYSNLFTIGLCTSVI